MRGNSGEVIAGYADEASTVAGEQMVLRVATDSPAFRVLAYRWGAQLEPVGAWGWFEGVDHAQHLPFHDWGRPETGLHGEELAPWAGYRLAVPAGWRPGVYTAVLLEGDGRGDPLRIPEVLPSPDARTGRALFVIRGAANTAPAPIVYKLPLFTYQAYNLATPEQSPSWCLYALPPPDALHRPVPPSVSLRRPGGGTGGTPWDASNFDPFDATPRQTFVHWDAPFVAWLERSGYRVDYCTDLDLHRDPGLLDRHRLLVSAGHDEYWSDAMREHAESFVRGGGNVAFFSGNTCWWRICFDDDWSFRRVSTWSDRAGPDRPENLLTGVSFRNGGERDRDDHPVPIGYRVQHADHWIFAGTGLCDGDSFGDRPDEYLVGYECDGAHFERALMRTGRPVRPTGDDGTPSDFAILGVGDTEPSGWGHGNRAATMGVHGPGASSDGGPVTGTVFTAATTDWSRLLRSGNRAVGQVTRNVVDRLGDGARPEPALQREDAPFTSAHPGTPEAASSGSGRR
jgi:hypothetical protein